MLATSSHVSGIKREDIEEDVAHCDPCKVGKSTRTPRSSRKDVDKFTKISIEKVYTDVVGRVKRQSFGTS